MQMIKRPRVLLEGKTRFSLNPLVVIHVWSPRILAAREIKERKKNSPLSLKVCTGCPNKFQMRSFSRFSKNLKSKRKYNFEIFSEKNSSNWSEICTA